MIRRVAAAALAITAFAVATPASATVDTDDRPCVTGREFDMIEPGTSKAYLTRTWDARGVRVGPWFGDEVYDTAEAFIGQANVVERLHTKNREVRVYVVCAKRLWAEGEAVVVFERGTGRVHALMSWQNAVERGVAPRMRVTQ